MRLRTKTRDLLECLPRADEAGPGGQQHAQQYAGLQAVDEARRDEQSGEQIPLGAGKP
jgi:hypothetical protein